MKAKFREEFTFYYTRTKRTAGTNSIADAILSGERGGGEEGLNAFVNLFLVKCLVCLKSTHVFDISFIHLMPVEHRL